MSIAIDSLQYLGFRLFGGLLSTFASTANVDTAGAVGSFYWNLSARHRRRAILNVKAAFPELDNAQAGALAEASMRSLMSMFLVDSLVMSRRVTPSGWSQHVSLGPLADTVEILLSDKPAILVTAHQGNFELLGYTLSMLGVPITALARPLDNPMLNAWILSMRTRHGLEIITKWGATDRVVEAISRGRRSPSSPTRTRATTASSCRSSIGSRRATSRSPCWRSASSLPVIAGFARRVEGDFRYEIICLDRLEPEHWEAHEDPIFFVSAWYTWAIERMVRIAPEQYWWLHRRWKSRPRFEREGKPMPNRLIAKLESLPWLTPEKVDRIRRHSDTLTADPAPGTTR